MNQQITKSQVAELIDYLANKELSFGCLITTKTQGRPFIFVRATRTRKCPFDGKMKRDFHCYFERTSPVVREEDAIILSHPIYIGDVLNKIKYANIGREFNNPTTEPWYYQELVRLWEPCGLNKPLQELLECGWEAIGKETMCEQTGEYYIRKQLKSPQVNELMCYLYELFIKKL